MYLITFHYNLSHVMKPFAEEDQELGLKALKDYECLSLDYYGTQMSRITLSRLLMISGKIALRWLCYCFPMGRAGAAVAQWVASFNGSIPGSCCLHVVVSLSETLNPKLLPGRFTAAHYSYNAYG